MDITQFLIGLAVTAGIFSLAVIAVIVSVIVYGARHIYFAIKGEEYVPLFGSKKQREYEHQDLLAGSTSESIANVLKAYSRVNVVGRYAQAGLAAIDAEKRKSSSFYAVLDSKFAPHSLSWEKFAVAADATHQAILQNCATLANHVQVFDHSAYHRGQRVRSSSSRRTAEQNTAMLDPTQAEKQRLLQASIAEMDAILASNEKLLLEFDKLTIELNKLADANTSANSDEIVNEIRTLIDETKYYTHQE